MEKRLTVPWTLSRHFHSFPLGASMLPPTSHWRWRKQTLCHENCVWAVRWHSTKWHTHLCLRIRMQARNVTHAIVNIKRYFNNSVSAKRPDVFIYPPNLSSLSSPVYSTMWMRVADLRGYSLVTIVLIAQQGEINRNGRGRCWQKEIKNNAVC